MSHYAEDALFMSPSVLVRQPGSDGRVHGKAAIRELYRRAIGSFPNLRFEVEDVIERPYGVIIIYRELGVFAERPGFTVEVFETSDRSHSPNTVYWGSKRSRADFWCALDPTKS
jgi:SnoaL-like domain